MFKHAQIDPHQHQLGTTNIYPMLFVTPQELVSGNTDSSDYLHSEASFLY